MKIKKDRLEALLKDAYRSGFLDGTEDVTIGYEYQDSDIQEGWQTWLDFTDWEGKLEGKKVTW